MMRATKVFACGAATAAQYYTRYLTDALGEVPGMWGGEQAAALGLAGEVSGNDLQALLASRDPASGTPLGRPFHDRYRKGRQGLRALDQDNGRSPRAPRPEHGT